MCKCHKIWRLLICSNNVSEQQRYVFVENGLFAVRIVRESHTHKLGKQLQNELSALLTAFQLHLNLPSHFCLFSSSASFTALLLSLSLDKPMEWNGTGTSSLCGFYSVYPPPTWLSNTCRWFLNPGWAPIRARKAENQCHNNWSQSPDIHFIFQNFLFLATFWWTQIL